MTIDGDIPGQMRVGDQPTPPAAATFLTDQHIKDELESIECQVRMSADVVGNLEEHLLIAKRIHKAIQGDLAELRAKL